MPQTSQLETRIRAVWQREQQLCLSHGTLVFLRWAVLLFLAGALVDWLIKLPGPGRAAVLLVVLGISLYKAWHAGWKRVRAFDATRTALQIEELHGGMESLLVTALQLRNSARRQGTSGALCELACRTAEASAEQIRPREAIRFDGLRRPAMRTAAAALLLSVVAATQGPLLLAGLGRIFAPWLPIHYPTRTQLELVGSDMVVQEGTPVRIAARLSGVVPRKAKITLRTGEDKSRTRTLPVLDNACEYEIETAFRGFEYRLAAGDARTEWHTVQVIGSPGVQRAQVRLDYPAYTKRSPETVETLTLTAPEGTGIHWTLSLDRAVREAAIHLAGQEPIPLTVSDDGLTVIGRQVAADSRAYSFSWMDREHGFAFQSPNHYLQVAPDRPPRVELTSPKRNVYATLGRELKLAFRGRDDHGVAECAIAYRVDKTEEETVVFVPEQPIDGSEQRIDWDYREVLPDLVVGQSITFAVELTDRYPPPAGPHRARSQTRRIQFLSKEDYLAHVEKQKRRLLSRLRTIYREERDVHGIVMRLDPEDPAFAQTCQLEAVRQGLMRERLKKLGARMGELTADLAANHITDESMTASLDRLRAAVLGIAEDHVTQAAEALRALAGKASDGEEVSDSAQPHAAHRIDSSARELGLLVLQLGYRDASDVMARELHAAAQTQAALRLRTILSKTGTAELADAQDRLAAWLTRLFAASPREKESTVDEALVEFTLTRLVKQMVNGGIDQRLRNAADFVRDGQAAEAARLQAEVVQALLKAEFRLRVGAEREALVAARELFQSQIQALRRLRAEIANVTPERFEARRTAFGHAQKELHRQLQLLLMPQIPARRARLFDPVVPAPPPAIEMLGAAEQALNDAVAEIEGGDRDAADASQASAEKCFAALTDMVTERIAALSRQVRIGRLAFAAQDTDERLDRLAERQLSLLEKAEDAAADGTDAAYLGEQQDGLSQAVEELRSELAERMEAAPVRSELPISVPARIEDAAALMRTAIPLLRANNPDEAAPLQEAANAALLHAQDLLAEHGKRLGALSVAVGATNSAEKPRPYVVEIAEEQRDMLAVTRKTKPADLPALAVPQKNLIHAVDATLSALDPIEHMIQSGTVMMFAKEDMDAAGAALADQDPVEALDAQEYIVETLDALRNKIDVAVPQYRYLLEVVEALHETAREAVILREAQRRLRAKARTKISAAALVGAQEGLAARTEKMAETLRRIAGLGLAVAAREHMGEAETALRRGDGAAATESMAQAERALAKDAARVSTAMGLLPAILAAPEPGGPVKDEIALLKDVLALAAMHKVAFRDSCAAPPNELATFEARLREFETACGPFIERARQHRKPEPEGAPGSESPAPTAPADLQRRLVAAKAHLDKAAAAAGASDPIAATDEQRKAAENLRHFLVEYALTFIKPAGAPPPQPPAPTTDFSETQDTMTLFMPGAVTGVKPPDGKLEWEVLGQRDRAALNENFARELPLEYRAILKDYYERLAQ